MLRPAFAPIYANQYSHSSSTASIQPSTPQWPGNHHQFSTTQYHSVASGGVASSAGASSTGTSTVGTSAAVGALKREIDVVSSSSSRKEKRQYKKRKHKTQQRDKPYPSPGEIMNNFCFFVTNNKLIYFNRTCR